MPVVPIPDLNEGDALSATWLNRVADVARSLEVTIGDGLVGTKGPRGVALALVDLPGFWAVLTYRSGANYSWSELIPQGTGWVTGGGRGFAAPDPAKPVTTAPDPAHEANENPEVPVGTRVWLRREPSSNVPRFERGNC